jgi:hypothetical protein
MKRTQYSSRDSIARRQDGMALLVTLMVMMLVSALMVGFVTAVIADQRASGLDRDQTQAYAAAHAGLEQLTSDLSQLFTRDFSPSGAQVSALRTSPPALTGFGFCAPEDTNCTADDVSGYMVAPTFVDGSGNPRPEDAVNGSAITAGPYQGFRGIITPYDITVTARSRTGGGAEVRMRRTLQTVAVPVFQFGMFSETDLSFHAGEPFAFAGRIHTNGNLFLAHTGSTAASCTSTDATLNRLRIMDRITAVGEVIRSHLPNGLITTSGYNGATCVPTLIASNPVNNQYRNLQRTEGSKITDLASADNEPLWTQRSTGTYSSNIRNGRTGARALSLPLVADLDDNGAPDAQPIDLIRRPTTPNEDTDAIRKFVYAQRFYAQASLRILLSDTAAEITNLPTVTGTPVALSGAGTALNYAPGLPLPTRPPLGNYEDPTWTGEPNLPRALQKGNHDESIHGGFISINMQRNNGTWVDVTGEILGLGIAGRNLADADSMSPVTNRWNSVPSGASDTCPEPNPNAVIRIQRIRDIPRDLGNCGVTVVAGNVTAVTQNEHDYWPNVLYDPREGHFRDGLSNTTTDLALGGIIHYVELDVNNLRKWLLGQFAGLGAGSGTQAKNDNGFIVYFSDRRNNKTAAAGGVETGEYGWEDVVNPASALGTPNNSNPPDQGEDFNNNGTLDTYGRDARNVPAPANASTGTIAGYPNPLHFNAQVTDWLTNTSLGIGWLVGTGAGKVPATVPTYVKPLAARANKAIFFRRALKIVNGGIFTSSPPAGNCTPAPCNNIIAPGLTVAAENPVYLQGNFNATSASATAEPNVAASIIADSVTLLSNNWNDIRSFLSPTDSSQRPATATGYRVAIVTGKGLAFTPGFTADASFGSDGGAHNFLRNLEEWDLTNVVQRYRGSLVSFFISRQAVGTFKCCDNDVYHRGTRDWSFDTDFLLPSQLPPGTPMFRDVNTLTFRQLLRPTQ